MTSWDDIFGTVLNALDQAAVPYMLTGSVASSYHGVPRATQDIDIVIAPTEQGLDKLVSGWKVDFIIQKKRPFNLEEFQRRIAVDLHGLKAWVASPEDVILAKLEWAAESQSDRQIEDAAGIIRRQGALLDGSYLSDWITKLGLDSEWDKAKRFAES